MKKLALLACSLFAVASIAQAKEIVAQPVITSSKEVVAEPTPVVEEVVAVVTPVAAPVVAERAPGYINLRVGGDVWSQYSSVTAGTQSLDRNTKDLGYQIAIEGYKTYDNIDLGLGLAYQDHAKRKGGDGDIKGAEYKSMPLYLTARHNMTYLDLPFTPYVKANAGYSFNFDSKDITSNVSGRTHTTIDDGAYWAAGAGIQYNDNLNVDIMYGTNYAKVKYDNQKHNNNYDAVTLSVGYNFNM